MGHSHATALELDSKEPDVKAQLIIATQIHVKTKTKESVKM